MRSTVPITGRHIYSILKQFITSNKGNDSAATRVLNDIVLRFSGTPLASRAQNLVNVLGRRVQIEEEQMNMFVTRATEFCRR